LPARTRVLRRDVRLAMPPPFPAQDQTFALFERLPIGVYVFRLENPPDEATLRIVFANSASGSTLGNDPTAIVGTLIGEYFPASLGESGIAAAYRDVVLSQEPRDFGVVSYGDEDLPESRFALSAFPLGPDLVAILFDNLSASPARAQELSAIVDSATDAILSEDVNGTILSWNRSAERVYGYSAAEAVGRSITMLLPPDRPQEIEEIIARFRSGERVQQFETKRVRKDGTIIDVALAISPLTDLSGNVVGAATIARDITAQKKAADRLQRLAAIVAASEDAITSRTPDGIIVSWNAGAEKLFGYAAEEMIGQSVDVLEPGHVTEEVQEIRRRMQQGERQAHPYEVLVRRKDGVEVPVSVSSSPITDDSGQFIGVASVMRDMTSHRRLEDQLRQSQKLEAIGSLAGGVAHDFNNVLTVIRTASESVLGDLEDGAIREKVRQIDLAAQHASALTFQLLAFSRHQVLLSERIDLNKIVRSTSEMAGRLVGEHVQVELMLDDNVADIEIDRGQLQQVILNLFVNARDAMPGGGRLRVRTSGVVLDDAYVDEHFEVPRGDYVLLEITDTGKGMDAETSSRIFDPFFTTKTDGTGLGLATVYGIIRQSGGQIFVYSELGIGTTFKVYLPPARGGESQAEVPEPAKHAPHKGHETILLVEDADLLRPLVVEILRASGYNVLAAADGFEALSLFESSNGTIDLLLTDVVMPGMSGRELAEQVIERSPTMRVIFTSGYPDDTSIHTLIDQRHITFIQKPYAGTELLATIRETLAS
jgi:PAS domain S-box-containing protein